MQASGLRLLVSSGMRQRHTNASPSLRRVMPTTHLRRHNSARFGEEKRSAHCVNQNQVSWRKIASSPLRSGNIVLSKQQAISAVEARLVSLEPPANGDSWIVIPEYVEERASCFVVFWGSRVFHETREVRFAVAGNAPYIVDRVSGLLSETGTEATIEKYIAEFESSRNK